MPWRDAVQGRYGDIASREKFAEMDAHIIEKRPDLWIKKNPDETDPEICEAAAKFVLGPGGQSPDTSDKNMPHGDRATKYSADLYVKLEDDNFKNQGGDFLSTTTYGHRAHQAAELTRRNRDALGITPSSHPAVCQSLHYGQKQLVAERRQRAEESMYEAVENDAQSTGASSSAGPSSAIVPAVPATPTLVDSGGKTLPIAVRNAFSGIYRSRVEDRNKI